MAAAFGLLLVAVRIEKGRISYKWQGFEMCQKYEGYILIYSVFRVGNILMALHVICLNIDFSERKCHQKV